MTSCGDLHTISADIARVCRLTIGIQSVELIRGRSLGEFWEVYVQVSIASPVTYGEAQIIVGGLKKKIRTAFPQIQHVWMLTSSKKARDEAEENYWSDHLFAVRPGKLATQVTTADGAENGTAEAVSEEQTAT